MFLRRGGVSIHAPARGATYSTAVLQGQEVGFNPRPRAGGDRLVNVALRELEVSIHAPARGATWCA